MRRSPSACTHVVTRRLLSNFCACLVGACVCIAVAVSGILVAISVFIFVATWAPFPHVPLALALALSALPGLRLRCSLASSLAWSSCKFSLFTSSSRRDRSCAAACAAGVTVRVRECVSSRRNLTTASLVHRLGRDPRGNEVERGEGENDGLDWKGVTR
jgi:hypothetical protein